ncbi:tetratricopeptide repeat protein [Legionella septentrionalis]|nr:tetratricopeptide repeat protein [Legionella septentrionalis]
MRINKLLGVCPVKTAGDFHKAARQYRNEKQLSQAEQLLAEALTKYPAHFGCLLEMGYVAYQLKDYAKAETYLRKAQSCNTKLSVSFYRTLAKVCIKTGKHDEGIQILRSGLKQYPDDEPTKNLLGDWENPNKKNIVDSPIEEFPKVDLNTLNKFVNYDEFLGWEPKPSYEIEGIPAEKMTRRTRQIDKDGTRYQPPAKQALQGPKIEFFGDSRCFCNEVNPDETFQYYLENDYGIGPCKNFGVGNYGADQALLRANRKLSGHGSIAVIVVQSLSLLRIGSVYKHYIERGNVWAVKPRFTLRGEDSLQLIMRPFIEKSELCNLQNYSDFFHQYDDHYKAFLAANSGNENKLLNTKSQEYLANLARGEQGKIFALLGREFCTLAKSRGCIDAFIIVDPYIRGVRGRQSNHEEVMRHLHHWFEQYAVPLYDFGNAWFAISDEERKLFSASSTHLSAAGNRFKADWIVHLLTQRGLLKNKRRAKYTYTNQNALIV